MFFLKGYRVELLKKKDNKKQKTERKVEVCLCIQV